MVRDLIRDPIRFDPGFVDAEEKWVLSLIHKESINKILSGYFDILIGCLDNDMQGMLRK